MAYTVKSVTCPSCGANLPVEEGRNQVFCSYCGTKVLITNENEHIYRHVDDAEIKKTEADSMLELKRLEIAENELVSKRKVNIIKIIISVILGIIMLICLGFGNGEGSSAVGTVCGIIIMWMWIYGAVKD